MGGGSGYTVRRVVDKPDVRNCGSETAVGSDPVRKNGVGSRWIQYCWGCWTAPAPCCSMDSSIRQVDSTARPSTLAHS